MKKRISPIKDNDPLSLVLLLVLALFFVSIVGICFSVLIADTHREVVQRNDAKNLVKSQDLPKVQKTKDDIQDLKVGEVTGVVTAVEGDMVTIKTSVYGEQEHEITIKLDQRNKDEMVKYETDDAEQNPLLNVTKIKMDFKNLEPGDLLTLRYPNGVMLKEVANEMSFVEEIIVDDEFDASKLQE